jgi:CRP-like cAMP-binding protein
MAGVNDKFIAELQLHGTFAEYNQQTIITAGLPADAISCIISGRVDLTRRNDDFGKVHVATLDPGAWFGERDIFLRLPAEEEAFAQGEVILWTIPPDTLRDLFFASPEAVQLLFNFGTLLAQKLTEKNRAAAAAS